MNYQIKSRLDGTVLFEGEYASLKLCLEAAVKIRSNLRYADLGGADLGGADLGGADLGGADLGGADLRYANLGGADLGGADLGGADLGGANLGGAKNYGQSHDVFAQLVISELIRFTVHEQEMAFRIFALRLCWKSIQKKYGKKIVPVFKKLAKMGYGEFLEQWKMEARHAATIQGR